jgi:hypothetical protein
MSDSVAEKSSKSFVSLALPAKTRTSTPSGRLARSRANREWIERKKALRSASTGRFGVLGVYTGGPQRSTTIRVAPESIARRSGTLSTTPPSM